LSHIFPEVIKKSVYYDLKVKPFEYLRGMLYMNSFLEKGGHKLFQSLPLRSSLIPKHIMIDTTILVSVLTDSLMTEKEGGSFTKAQALKNIKAYQHEAWGNVLNTELGFFKRSGYKFRNLIRTDGVSCALLFIREDLKELKWGKVPREVDQDFFRIEDLSREQLNALSGQTVVGCDPGKHSLVYLVDEKGNTLHYTSSQRRVESYGKRNKRVLEQAKQKERNILEMENLLLTTNSKTSCFEKFKDYLVKKDRLNKQASAFYKKDV